MKKELGCRSVVECFLPCKHEVLMTCEKLQSIREIQNKAAGQCR
jgi:hypothetical protein